MSSPSIIVSDGASSFFDGAHLASGEDTLIRDANGRVLMSCHLWSRKEASRNPRALPWTWTSEICSVGACVFGGISGASSSSFLSVQS